MISGEKNNEKKKQFSSKQLIVLVCVACNIVYTHKGFPEN